MSSISVVWASNVIYSAQVCLDFCWVENLNLFGCFRELFRALSTESLDLLKHQPEQNQGKSQIVQGKQGGKIKKNT